MKKKAAITKAIASAYLAIFFLIKNIEPNIAMRSATKTDINE